MTTSALLGEIVTWDIASTEVAYAEVQESLKAAGLDEAVAADMSIKSAFGRAAKHLKDQRSIDKLEYKGGIARFQLTKKAIKDLRLEFDYEATIELDCDSGSVTCTESPELAKEAELLLSHARQTRNAADITRMVQRLFTSHADLYPINPKKGVAYFVPDAHREFTAKVECSLPVSVASCFASRSDRNR